MVKSFIVIALKTEANSIINHFDLVQIEDKYFDIYKNENIFLIISKMGVINSAVATTYLLTKYKSKKEDKVINIGICGSNRDNYNIGDIFLINKIVDMNSKKVFHLENGNYSISCYEKPQLVKTDFADMESVGFYMSAKKFIDKKNIFIVKIVSDYMCEKIPSSKFIDELFQKQLQKIESFIR